MATEWIEHPERFLFNHGDNSEEYLSLIIDILRRLSPDIAIERFASTAPRDLLLHSPLGGARMDTLRTRLIRKMHAIGAIQGDRSKP